ncbi:MAG: DUF1566 domain-containing protein, partial [Leptospiraceae bacterium]|nr:DUF1566 domain-containing protein [Leptospiraceae bacterium]
MNSQLIMTGTMKKTKQISMLVWGLLFTLSLSAEFTEEKSKGIISESTQVYWEYCDNGSFKDSKCSGEGKDMSWEEASKACETLDLEGKKWRLPSSDELRSLLNYIKDTKEFSSAEAKYYYWTKYRGLYGVVNKERIYFGYDQGTTLDSRRYYKVRCISNDAKGSGSKTSDRTTPVDD